MERCAANAQASGAGVLLSTKQRATRADPGKRARDEKAQGRAAAPLAVTTSSPRPSSNRQGKKPAVDKPIMSPSSASITGDDNKYLAFNDRTQQKQEEECERAPHSEGAGTAAAPAVSARL